ncbi:CBO0543 family protein [Bacillus salipaludis]|uniref:CBO0543 family protein n=1 Tax=Bacillus salipaludis TaxID=2547811 RepID=UPI0038B2A1D5
MQILGLFTFIVAVWRWGDWRNWEKYQSTILFKITCALLYEVLTYNYPLWEYSDFDTFLPTHTLNSLAITFVGFTCTVLLFLSCYPETKKKTNFLYYFLGIVKLSNRNILSPNWFI